MTLTHIETIADRTRRHGTKNKSNSSESESIARMSLARCGNTGCGRCVKSDGNGSFQQLVNTRMACTWLKYLCMRKGAHSFEKHQIVTREWNIKTNVLLGHLQ